MTREQTSAMRTKRESEIRERLTKISPAPWCLEERNRGFVYCDDSLGSAVAKCALEYTIAVRASTENANAALIANAPSDLQYLLDELSAVRAELQARKDHDAKNVQPYIEQLERERRLLAKLAADSPQFFNPLVAFEAQEIRDRVLNEKASLTPRAVPTPAVRGDREGDKDKG